MIWGMERDLLIRALEAWAKATERHDELGAERDVVLACVEQLRTDELTEWITVREMNGLYQRIRNQRESVKRLQMQVDVLRDVLKPFASIQPDEGGVLKASDFRNAREAYEKPMDNAVFVGSGNVFRDLEVQDPECRQELCDVKAELAKVRAERDVMYARAHILRTYEPVQWREQVGYLLREIGIDIGLVDQP